MVAQMISSPESRGWGGFKVSAYISNNLGKLNLDLRLNNNASICLMLVVKIISLYINFLMKSLPGEKKMIQANCHTFCGSIQHK